MNALDCFRAELPRWRPAVEAWLDAFPASVRTSPPLAALAYLFDAPVLVALGSRELSDLEQGWIDWTALEERARRSGDVALATMRAGQALAAGDPGPALGLMLVFPAIDAFRWVHAAGTVFEIVSERMRRHALSVSG
ncbi:MAG: hypothetical protein ACRDYF_15920 [Acidimicrobiia bacterium]